MNTMKIALVAALVLAAAAAGPAEAGESDQTIFVPEGWGGAYDFGYAPVIRTGNMVIVSGVPAGGPGTYEEKIRRMYERSSIWCGCSASIAEIDHEGRPCLKIQRRPSCSPEPPAASAAPW
jgi:hypothetical protein